MRYSTKYDNGTSNRSDYTHTHTHARTQSGSILDLFPTWAQRLLDALYLPVTVALPLSGVGLVLRNSSLASALSDPLFLEFELLFRPRSVDARKDGLPGSSKPLRAGIGGATVAACWCASAFEERAGSDGRDGPAVETAGAPNIDRLLTRDVTELLRELSI